FEVAGTGGDTQLGGDDFDALIVNQVVDPEVLQSLPKSDLRALKVAARAAREALTDDTEVTFEAELSDGQRITRSVKQQEFEQWAQPLVLRTLDTATRALRDADLEKE